MTRNEVIQYCLDHQWVDLLNEESQLTDLELLAKFETKRYPKRREDGQKFSDLMGAKLLLSGLPDSDKEIIDQFYNASQSFLCQGWWKSALRDLKKKTPSGVVTQQTYDEVVGYITFYINNNY